MPLPLILGGLAAIAGATGIGTAVAGGVKMIDANSTMQKAKKIQDESIALFEKENKNTTVLIDSIGQTELETLKSFQKFSDIFEQIQNKPDFKEAKVQGVNLPPYNPEKLKQVSVGAGVLLGGLGGATLGTAGGFAAAGATTAAVMALGTASTGTAIASLSGVAATNATLAALGGGAIAAGGGGMALGTAVLGAATLGVGLLVGGLIFNATGSGLSEKADEAMKQATENQKKVTEIVAYLRRLRSDASEFKMALDKVVRVYTKHLNDLNYIVCIYGKTDWRDFSPHEQIITENTVRLVALIYKMCQTKLVIQAPRSNALNQVNHVAIQGVIGDSNRMLQQID